jgi:hypothetical protein
MLNGKERIGFITPDYIGEQSSTVPQYRQIAKMVNVPENNYDDEIVSAKLNLVYANWIMLTEEQFSQLNLPQAKNQKEWSADNLFNLASWTTFKHANLRKLAKDPPEFPEDYQRAIEFVASQDYRAADGEKIDSEFVINVAMLANILDHFWGRVPGAVRDRLTEEEWFIGRPAVEKLGLPIKK